MRTRVTQARRRLRAQRPEALDHERRRRELVHRVRDVRPGDEAQGHRVLRRRREHAGRQGGRKEDKMGQRASNTTDVIFEDVQGPEERARRPEDGGLQGRDEDVRSLAPVDRGDARPA